MKTTAASRSWIKTMTLATALSAATLTAGVANAHGGGGGGGGGHSSGSHSMSSSHSSSNSFKSGSFKQSSGSGSNSSHSSSNHNFKRNNLPLLLLNNNNNSSHKKPIGGLGTVTKFPVKTGTPITTGGGSGKPITLKDPIKTVGGVGSVGPTKGNGGIIPIDPGKGNGPITTGGSGHGNSHGNGSGSGHHHSCWNNFIFWGIGYPGYGVYPYRNGANGYHSTYYNNTYVTPVAAATPATVVDGIDLELVDVRLLDGGRPDEDIGPRYRISFRNVGGTPIESQFNVSLAATTEMKVSDNMPQTTTRVSGVNGNEVKFVDMRLPASVFEMTTATGAKTEFSKLLVFVDSNQEVKDTNRENNMTGLDRTTIKTAE